MKTNETQIDNPFVTTGYVSADYFCDREKETEDIVRFLTNGNNVALISPRRYGKTDLIRLITRPKVIKVIFHDLNCPCPSPVLYIIVGQGQGLFFLIFFWLLFFYSLSFTAVMLLAKRVCSGWLWT